MQDQESRREAMTIHGDLHAARFGAWIERHAARLGLPGAIQHASDRRIEIELSGPAALIDMLEVGCLLGPIEVWVDRIERRVLAA